MNKFDVLKACYTFSDGDCYDSVLFQVVNLDLELKNKVRDMVKSFMNAKENQVFDNTECLSFSYDLKLMMIENYNIRIGPILTLSLLELFIDSKVVIGTAVVENVVFEMQEDENE